MQLRPRRSKTAYEKHLEAQLRAALSKQSMCAEHIKGHVDVSYSWDDGESDTRKYMMSDDAERLLSDIAHAVVFHALTRNAAAVTLTVHKARSSEME